MNTPAEWKTVAVIHNAERLEFWKKILGGDRAPIKSILTNRAKLPDKGEQDVYILDTDALTAEQKEKLIKALAERFDLQEEFVRLHLIVGVPILAEDVSVSSTDSGLFYSMLGDIDDQDQYFTDQYLHEEDEEE